AECAAGFLRQGGLLVVSESPVQPGTGLPDERWLSGALRPLGLCYELHHTQPGANFAVLRKIWPCDPRYPRRTGVPSKRPLY
ncbi:MAG: hypothetical protein ACRDZ5_07255, partial [Acidimicrobiales bacterium]